MNVERYRRAATIAFSFEAGVFAGGNFYTGTYEKLDPRHVAVLDALRDWRTAEELADHPVFAGDAGFASHALESLVKAGLAVRESDPPEQARAFAEHWREWGLGTQIYHATSRDAPYTETQPQAQQVYKEMVEQPLPPPPALKSYPDAPRIELPRDLPPLDVSLETVLASRRTWRAFTGGEVALRRLSKLLLVSFGATGRAEAGEYGQLLFKTSPSGGARHPTEAYVVALACEGVPAGLYHYDPAGHALEQLGLGDHRGDVIRWLANQYWFQGSAVVIFTTVVVRRLSFKYKHGRAYRVLLMDQGHLGQTFVLAATALGLGAWQTAAFHDTEVEAALGIDGIEETAVYALGAGITPIPTVYPGKTVELWTGPPKRLELPPP
ncbi:MAG TPA: SagB family peptide dehydrogenase [Planctomycetota bacterium]|nr:SagB family peptide dehydrogenase [Planctomycetota bacterium]